MRPIVWTIAGSDSSCGAGIQRDLLTFSDFGVHGSTVITTLTAQSSSCIKQLEPCGGHFITSQIDVLHSDGLPRAIKLGALAFKQAVQAIANYLYQNPTIVVYDPVFFSSTGVSLLTNDFVSFLTKALFPYITLLTPNIFEAERLLNMRISCHADMEIAAKKLLKLGIRNVLLTGGHMSGSIAADYFSSPEKSFWLKNNKLNKPSVRGTGCVLSSAITSLMALGHDLYDALVIAKMYMSQEIRNSYPIKKDLFFMKHCGWPSDQQDLPYITKEYDQQRFKFPDIENTPIGFYPIVDSFHWVECLVKWGVQSIQLRIKEQPIKILEHSIKQSVQLCKKENVRLFINDYWELAIKYKAYAVHLGQEDIESADFQSLEESGIHLGISTHCFYEVARAHACSPSYLAFGPIYETSTKKMRFTPRGLKQLSYWSSLLSYPLVAIGGIDVYRIKDVLSAEVNGVSVVSAVTKSNDPAQAVRFFLNQVGFDNDVKC